MTTISPEDFLSNALNLLYFLVWSQKPVNNHRDGCNIKQAIYFLKLPEAASHFGEGADRKGFYTPKEIVASSLTRLIAG